jgi:Zn-finger protein
MSDIKTQYSHFANSKCEYFPCHKNVDTEIFNCLFCYCPLYALGDQCGGNFVYLANGIKDCGACVIPHGQGGYEYIVKNFNKVNELAKKNRIDK